MRGIVVGLLVVSAIGCSRTTEPVARDEQPKVVRAEDHVTLDQFLDRMAISTKEQEAKSLLLAEADISKLSPLDRQHEQKILDIARKADLSKPMGVYRDLAKQADYDANTSPASKYLAARCSAYYFSLPALRQVIRWGWDNVLSKPEQKFDTVSEWFTNFAGAFEYHEHLGELNRCLRNGESPSREARMLYTKVFGTDRLPHGWH